MKILLISGHGGTPYDSGAVGNGYTEAVETRRMATAVAPLLRNYGFSVTMYDQSQDAYKVVTQGGSLPLSGIDYVMEFHLNSAANDLKGNGRTTGSEIFVHVNEAGIGVEQAILKRLQALGFTNRGVKRSSGLAVLKHVYKRGVSHALIETCFIDDKDDMELYKTKFYEIAHAIADGVAEGFGVAKEEPELTESEIRAIARDEINKAKAEVAALKASEWHASDWDAAKEAGLLDGTRPRSPLTREEMSTVLQRCGLIGK